MAYPYIPGYPGHTSGTQKTVNRIVIHGTVSPTVKGGARSVARYFQSSGAGGSAHYIVDPGEVVRCYSESTICWHAPPNAGSIGIELCDPQAGSSSRWSNVAHEAMLKLAAKLTREVAARHGVPLRRLSVADLKAGRKGICGHVDVSNAFRQTNHTDPGAGFPWAHFMQLVTGSSVPVPPTPQEDDMPTPEQLWNRKWSKSDSPVNGWEMDSIIANSNARLRNVESKLNALAAKAGVDVDEAAIARGVLAGLTPDAIAQSVVDALPADLATQVLDGLKTRLEA